VDTGRAELVPDGDGRRGWTLYVNGVPSSHVDLDDPTRLDFEYVVNGEPILQAVRAAGIFSDVPANRAHLLAGRIGCVVEAERRHLTRDFEIGDAWLDRHALVRNIDVENSIETR